MAFQIRISPAAVRAAAQRNHAIAEIIENTASELSALAAELGDSWDGGASIQTIDSLQEIRAAVGRVADGVHDSAEMLNGVAEAFESLDGGSAAFSAVGIIKPRYMVGCPAPRPVFALGVNESLRIMPEQVRIVAHKLRERAEMFAKTGNDYRATISALANDWEGNAYVRFADAATELAGAFPQIVELLDELSSQIITIANRYEELDEALRSMF